VSERTENSVVIQAPIDLVWTMTNDVSSWPELFSEYSAVNILNDDGTTIVFRLHTHPDKDGKIWSWTSERVLNHEDRTVRARRVETGPFEFMHIAWTYREVADGVEMRWTQEFHLKPEAPVDDAFMAAQINRNSLEQMTRIKRLVEERSHAGRAAA
jgi:aromatase